MVKEVAALLMVLKNFDVYVTNCNQNIVIYSDHNPLTFVMLKEISIFWFLQLFVVHVKGNR